MILADIILIIFIAILLLVCVYIYYFWYYGKPDTKIEVNQINEPTDKDIINVFAPHQDDEVLAVGGYINRAVKNGAKVNVIFVSDGNKHGLNKVRENEAINVLATLGVPQNQIICLRLPDGRLAKNISQLKEKIDAVLKETKPNIVFVSDSLDLHPDHAVLGQNLLESTKKTGVVVYSYLIHYKAFPRPQRLDVSAKLYPPRRLKNQSWREFNLNSSEVGLKQTALLRYKSQLRTPILRSLMFAFVRQNEIFMQR